MIVAALAAVALNAGPDMQAYRLRVTGNPGSRVTLRASGTTGWIESFCTSKVCSVGHTDAAIPKSGVAIVQFDVYRTDESSPHRGRVTISSDQAPSLSLEVAIR